eukprot:TRINITY_DN513_c0_g1_i1.p1 TRINITY_DN513_c0_g1~~TRINITY_DN513_c0_g1_i1.p1  ORF type:complete len:136 (+),score=16.57 TRINITY_DN513_c0_g1_i1:40-447(+)
MSQTPGYATPQPTYIPQPVVFTNPQQSNVVYSSVPQTVQQPTIIYTNGAPIPDVGTAWTWSIITCLFCFWPLAIVGMVFARKAGTAVSSGDHELAEKHIAKSIRFSQLSLGIGAIFAIAVVVFYAVLFISGGFNL